MTDLSLEQLSYFAAKARLPEKLVLDTGKETVEKFMAVWNEGKAVLKPNPKLIAPISELLSRIPLVREV